MQSTDDVVNEAIEFVLGCSKKRITHVALHDRPNRALLRPKCTTPVAVLSHVIKPNYIYPD